MPSLIFIPENDPLLRKPAKGFGLHITKAQQKQISSVVDLLMSSDDAMAIAAPQVGIPLRFFVARKSMSDPFIIVDPKVVWSSDKIEQEMIHDAEGNPLPKRLPAWEACLSFPGKEYLVVRPYAINVEYRTQKGVYHKLGLEGVHARVFMHEIDHLNGVVLPDIAEASRDIFETDDEAPVLRM